MNLPRFGNQTPKTKLKTPIWNLGFGNWKLGKGFTLIELLVVIAIIGILVAAATVSYTNAQQKARDNKRKSDFKSIQQALELYLQTAGAYPRSITGKIRCYDSYQLSDITWGQTFKCTKDGTNYDTFLNPLPKDLTQTSPTSTYYFNSKDSPLGLPPTTYTLSADLENNSDPERSTGSSPSCTTPQPGRDYCVRNP